ncbi:MAG: hypothetical protein KJO11_16260 [Gemmatimonadetes bacterium]|nr:hypothetical protein [Gemmatimonadota bacterium]
MTENRLRSKLARGAVRLSLILFGFALAEIGLWVAASLAGPIDRLTAKSQPIEPLVTDSLLMLRGNPLHPEHDAWGFRNDSVPARAGIVTLGDSHTYGTSVSSDQAWPSLLAEATGRTVYNFGMPTWGALQYESILPRALELDPESIVVALYMGNDLFDAFVVANERGVLESTVEPDEWAELNRLEASASIEAEARRLFRAGDPEPSVGEPGSSGLRDVLSDRSRLYGLLRAGRRLIQPRAGQSPLLHPEFSRAVDAVTEERAAYVAVYDGPEWRGLLSPAYRRRVLDLEDVRIRIGLEQTIGALVRMAAVAAASGTVMVVALLPTKESVFAPRMQGAVDHPDLPGLWAAEDEVRARILEALSRAGVPALDLLPALTASPAQPFFENIDGYLDAEGHAVVAHEVARALNAPGRALSGTEIEP